ncbi:transglycosylase family protein [Kitasatospora sp. CB02891]|uniref:transglycosylase family protein n=1 Tax=Kitasatospora sp. CB02891 TaxID=2020329 RepID=UPI000C27EDE7|nr:transglycosylase family protein [Kitasatospora sp. CB02891]PJN29623.1 hypothetical protein CG736_03620 [Kitasatospora sp. CB02891]
MPSSARLKCSLVVAAASLLTVLAPAATVGTASAASVSTWDKVAQCESGGNWSINTNNGYYGGLQFDSGTWAAYGGRQYAPQANLASKQQQILIGEKVLAVQGQGAWHTCGPQAGLGADHADPYPSVPPVTSQPTNVQLDIVGGDGALYSQFGNYSSGSFNSAWAAISGVPISRLTSVNVGGNLVHFYAVADGRVFGRDHIPSSNTWTGWSEIPGGASGVKDIAASASGSSVILSIVGGDGALYTQFGNYDAGHFDASWVRRGGAELTRITSVTGNSDTIRIYGVGAGGRVYGADYTLYANNVGAWGEIPGGATGVKDITASTSGTNVILSMIGGDGALYTQFGNYDAGHFDAAWVRRSGVELTNLSSVPANNGDVVRIYAVGPGGRVYGADFTLYSNSVGAWGEIPGNATNARDIAAANSN